MAHGTRTKLVRWLLAAACSLATGLATAAVTPWIPVELGNGHIRIPSVIQGHDGWSIIDTGANVNGIGERFVAASGVRLRKGGQVVIEGVHGTARRTVFREVRAELFGAELRFKDVVPLGLGDPSTQLILGADFLERFVFQFDYPNQRMRAITRDSVDVRALSNIPSKRDRASGMPLVRVRLNDEVDAWVLLDTGNAGGLILKRGIAARRGWLDEQVLDTIEGRGVNASGTFEGFSLPLLQFGPFTMEQAQIRVPAEGEDPVTFSSGDRVRSSRIERGSYKDGILGHDILKHFVLTIDYREGAVHVGLPEDN